MPDAYRSVEELVRSKLAEALGGRRGIVESAVPTIAFTVTYVATHDLKLALTISIAITVGLLIVRLIQRSTVQFVVNALFAIGIAAVFASRSGEARDVFLPGILYNTAYGAVLLLTVLIRWPLVGFMVGAVTGDPTGWRNDPAMVKLCSRLTLLLALPCVLRVLVQYPLYEAGEATKSALTKSRDLLPADEGSLEQAFASVCKRLKLRAIDDRLAFIARETANTLGGTSELTQDSRDLLTERGELLTLKRKLLSQK
jgi:hypothetical protein